jgi:hypothetical protein
MTKAAIEPNLIALSRLDGSQFQSSAPHGYKLTIKKNGIESLLR